MTLKTNPTIESLEGRTLFAADSLLAINFTDEVMSDEHFAYAADQAKKLGVGAVRLWISIKHYEDRPNAWDIEPRFMSVGLDNVLLPHGYERTMDRAFQLKHLGFKVMMTVVPDDGIVPTSDAQVTGFFTHLLNSTQTPDGTETLRDVVDQWEIGNEPDLVGYWADASMGTTTGLKNYVDKLLLPAASVLHSGSVWEKVVSAGVSNKPEDMNTILSYLNSKGKLGAIDYAGFHPYASYNPDDASSNQQATNILKAKGYADSFGKKMIATEWNIRGFPYDGSQDTKWAKALDLNYRNYLLPHFYESYYFSIVNNYAYRGGSVSARPAGLLEHDGSVPVSQSSHPDIQADYQASPLVPAEPFYSMFKQWQYGKITGKVTNSTNGQPVANAVVYIDANNTGNNESIEIATFADVNGNYTLNYSTSQLKPGTYAIRSKSTTNSYGANDPIMITIGSAGNATGVNFSLKPKYKSPGSPTTGSITGSIYHDYNGNGALEDHDRIGDQQQVYIDLNNNQIFDTNEPSAISAADTGLFKMTFSVFDTVNHPLRVVLPTGWAQSQTPMVRLSRASQELGMIVGVIPDSPPTPRLKGSISGIFFSDTNKNGIQDTGESLLANRVVYIDSNDNGTRDEGEYAFLSIASPTAWVGQYFLRNLTAGTYVVRTEISAGESVTTPASFTITLTTDERKTGFNFGIGPDTNSEIFPGTISGAAFNDSNANGLLDTGETSTSGKTIFIDTNQNLKLDAGELSAVTDSVGKYKFSNLTPGTYYLSRVYPSGYKMSNNAFGYVTVTVGSAQDVTGIHIGSTTGTTTPGGGGADPNTASISGYLWNDNNANGIQDGTETRNSGKVVYIDANANGILDSTEKKTTTDASGNYLFSSLAASTYRVRRVLPAGYKMVSPSAGYQLVTLLVGQALAGVNLGSKQA